MAIYKRVIIKLSGEALAGEKGFGIDESMLEYIVEQIKKVREENVEIGIIIGGGNFWRGRQALNMEKSAVASNTFLEMHRQSIWKSSEWASRASTA